MKRTVITIMTFGVSAAAQAQNTLPEIHMFFSLASESNLTSGLPPISPANLSTNPSAYVFPGSHIYLAVWIRALQGDAAGQLAVTSYNYEIAAQDPQSGLTA